MGSLKLKVICERIGNEYIMPRFNVQILFNRFRQDHGICNFVFTSGKRLFVTVITNNALHCMP